MKIFSKTDIGKARDINQDYYYISPEDEEIKICILADGMGGYFGGEIASKLATNSVKSYVENNFNIIKEKNLELQKLVRDAIEYANMIVREKAKENVALEQMGTTLEICLIYNKKLYIGHIGDSRIYRIRKGTIKKITKDHSYVEELIEDGTITEEEAINHPKKNMLTKAVGCNSFAEPDVIAEDFQDNDIILMCSDGLTNMVTEEEILETVKSNVDKAADELVTKANNLGGFDNISVIIIKNYD